MRVFCVGDGRALDTGFGAVMRYATDAFVRRGWAVAQLALFDEAPYCDSRPYWEAGVQPYFPVQRGVAGPGLLAGVLNDFDPDVLVVIRDPGSAAAFLLNELAPTGSTVPVLLYAPLEGAPVLPEFGEAFRSATVAMTYTRWAAERLHAEHGVDVRAVPHGVDSSTFVPFANPEERAATRQLLGWDDKYVVMYVARNAKRKNHDRLVKAAALLHGAGMADLMLYLHTTPFAGYSLGGWRLDWLAHWAGLPPQAIQFSRQLTPERGEPAVSLAAKYAAADLYVHPASVEGFGLPLLEAMACGLPVVIPDDAGNIVEVCGGAELARVAVRDWETWFTGAQLANVHPSDLAGVIAQARQHPDWAAQQGHAGRQRALCFPWEAMGEALADAVEQTAAAAGPLVVVEHVA